MASDKQHPTPGPDHTADNAHNPETDASEVYEFRDLPPSRTDPASATTVGPLVSPEPTPPERWWRREHNRTRAGAFWVLMGCNLTVFVTSICIMVLELTASRLIAKHIGNSLYTWTSVIGVVLAGITIGNYIGGWLADRFSPTKTLGWLFLVASFLCFSVLWLDPLAGRLDRPAGMQWQSWVLVIVAGLFLLPSVAMGTISPVVASFAVSRTRHTGFTIGSVYAWGALGSIVGTFLAGFYLIDAFGTKAIVAMTAGTLAVMGIFVASGQRTFRAAVCFGWLQFILLMGLAAATTGEATSRVTAAIGGLVSPRSSPQERRRTTRAWNDFGRQLGNNLHDLGTILNLRDDDAGEYHDESNYSYINVGDSEVDGDPVRYLKLDKLIHSYFNPLKPTALYYDYEKVYAGVTEQVAAGWDRTTSISAGELAGHDEILGKLPAWVQFDANRQTLELRGALTPARREKLLSLAPSGAYWLALEELRRRAQASDWGGFDSISLDEAPEGLQIPDALSRKVQYDPLTRVLNCFGALSREDVSRLAAAAPFARYYNLVDRLYAKSRRVSTLFIGGGGFVFPRWVEHKFPERPRIDVAEIDPAVKLAVQREMGLPPDEKTAVRTFIGDARNFVDDRLQANARLEKQGQAPVLYDFVYGDAFNDFSVPWHLTTLEFSRRIKRLLSEEGVYLVNIIDIYPRTQFPPKDSSSQAGTTFVTRVPDELLPGNIPSDDWTSCPQPFQAVELRRDKQRRLALGFRGVMPDDMHRRLLKLAAENQELRTAVEDLYRRTRLRVAGRFLGRYVRTVSEVFPHVYVFSSQLDRPSASRDTFVVVCSLKELDLNHLSRNSGYWSGRPFAWSETDEKTGERKLSIQMDALLALSRDKILTDDFAPVDNLLAPLFVRQ